MVLASSGIVTIPLDAAERLVAASATFRTVTGAADATAAMAFIHRVEAIDELTETDDCEIVNPRPRAIVDYSDSSERTRIGVGEWMGEGSVLIIFQFSRSDLYAITKDDALSDRKDKEDDSLTEFTNNVGAILSEMEANSGGSDGTNGYLNVVGFSLFDGPWRPTEDDEDQFFAVAYIARWIG